MRAVSYDGAAGLREKQNNWYKIHAGKDGQEPEDGSPAEELCKETANDWADARIPLLVFVYEGGFGLLEFKKIETTKRNVTYAGPNSAPAFAHPIHLPFSCGVAKSATTALASATVPLLPEL